MRKLMIIVAVAAFLPATAFAQGRGHGPPSSPPGHSRGASSMGRDFQDTRGREFGQATSTAARERAAARRMARTGERSAWREEFETGRDSWQDSRDAWQRDRRNMTRAQSRAARSQWMAERNAWRRDSRRPRR